jgi:hypothetical protein
MMEKQDDKGFLSRWSARKAEARTKTDDEAGLPATVQTLQDDVQQPVDPAELPSIDELTEDSDYTVFLRKGVPDTMRKAALRKLWVTEPSVVNYRPLVEYAWHNNEPGFGPLLPTDNVEEMLNRIFGGSPEVEKEPAQAVEPTSADADAAAGPAELAAPDYASDAPADAGLSSEPVTNDAVAAEPVRRRHGGALPS